MHPFMHSEKLASVQSSTTAHQGEQAASKSSPHATSEQANAIEAAINALAKLRNEARMTPPYW
jgi:hypothetical protein